MNAKPWPLATAPHHHRFPLEPFSVSGILLVLILLLLTGGCSRNNDTGPGKIRWDREVCERCAMAISDPRYAAEVRGGPAGEKTKLYKFDDIGCAVIWLDKQPWKNDSRTEVWVNDFRDGSWIDARKAAFIKGKTTPMDYGLGAQSAPAKDTLNFEQAKAHIHEVDKRLNRKHMHHPTSASPATP